MDFERVYVAISAASYRYVRNIADATAAAIASVFAEPTEKLILERWAAEPFAPNSLIFVIGEPFVLTPVPGCRIVFLNFSVVAFLGRWFDFGLEAMRTIRYKRRLLDAKLQHSDYVLDYWPEQAQLLHDKLGVPVAAFPICVGLPPRDHALGQPREFDVCIVGGDSPRRKRLIEKLRRAGLKLSPSNGVALEDAAIRSKLVLNVHTYRSNHLELPRMLGAYACGSVLVTERSYSIERHLPNASYVEADYAALPEQILDLVNDPARRTRIASVAYDWLERDYAAAAAIRWHELAQRFRSELT